MNKQFYGLKSPEKVYFLNATGINFLWTLQSIKSFIHEKSHDNKFIICYIIAVSKKKNYPIQCISFKKSTMFVVVVVVYDIILGNPYGILS